MEKYLMFKEEILNEEKKLKLNKDEIISLSTKNNIDFNKTFNEGKEVYVLEFKTLEKDYKFAFLDPNIVKNIEKIIDKYNNDFKKLIYNKMDLLNFDEYDKWEFTKSNIIGVNQGIFNINIYVDSLDIRKEEGTIKANNFSIEKCSYCGDGGCFYCEPNRFI